MFSYFDNDAGTGENTAHVRDIAPGEDRGLARSEGSTGVADVLWPPDGKTSILGTNHIPEPVTLETPQVNEVVRMDLVTGAQIVDDAFAGEFEPINGDRSSLIGLNEVPGEEGPQSPHWLHGTGPREPPPSCQWKTGQSIVHSFLQFQLRDGYDGVEPEPQTGRSCP